MLSGVSAMGRPQNAVKQLDFPRTIYGYTAIELNR
jgi:hypothetical protein